MLRLSIVLIALVLGSSMLGYGPIRAQSPFETLYTNLNFPVALAFAPDGRVFFNEKDTGNIRVIGSDGNIVSQPFATVEPLPPGVSGTEEGLIGIALDPNFATNHFLYVYWTYWDSATNFKHAKITRFTDTANIGMNPLDIFDFTDPLGPNPPTNHNGGYIKFGADGKLYVELGEYCAWECRGIALAQNKTSYAGKILRMNTNGSVPGDNPFSNSLVYAYGYRNGVGMDFSPTGKLIATMAGPDCCDRIFFVNSAANLGWPLCGVDSMPDCSAYTPSTYQWGKPTVTPTGIAYSTDPTVLYFGEDNTGNFMQLTLPSNGPAQIINVKTFSEPTIAVERAPDGRIWFTTPTTIYRFTPSSVTTQVLTTGVDAGLGNVNPNCPAPSGCSEIGGTSVTVTAAPSSGWQFSSWSTISGISPSSCSGNSCNFNMPNNAVTLKATFTQIQQVLFTGVDSGSGSVNPNCPGPNGCQETVEQSVTVTATPNSGWQFSSWSTQTGISCSGNPCAFSMSNNPVTLKATFTAVTLSQIAGFTGLSSGSVLLVTGDIAGNPHGPKPPGVGYQVGRDTTPLGFLSGMLVNAQPSKFDTNAAFVDSSGRPVGSWMIVFGVGGPDVDAVTYYYENTGVVAERAPVTWSTSGSNWVWTDRNGVTVLTVPRSSTTIPPGSSDVFVIQILRDSAGRWVVLMDGTSYMGTWAAAWYFKNVIYPNISTYTNGYYIVRWTDATSGADADFVPSAGDTFTILKQGTP
jgi:glucose/arabinose dehydrogenase